MVDTYEISLSRQGLLASIEGRGMAALLLDNESEALTYGRALLSEILGNHVLPYGITVDVRQDVSGGGYAVASGSSQWIACPRRCSWAYTARAASVRLSV